MPERASVIIPAFNEAVRLERTLKSIRESGEWCRELIVVDDGSRDGTRELAKKWADKVISHKQNLGKAQALYNGFQVAKKEIIVFLDADLGETARWGKHLIQPVLAKEADMTIAILPQTKKGGLGIIKHGAQLGIYWKTKYWLQAPLSGQRAVHRSTIQSFTWQDRGYGIEVGLTLDTLKAGYKVKEIVLPFAHRELGKTWTGFTHRLKQGLDIGHAFFSRRS